MLNSNWTQTKVDRPTFDRRFRYYILHDGKGVTYYMRKTRLWWKPFYWLGQKRWIREYFNRFARYHLTYD